MDTGTWQDIRHLITALATDAARVQARLDDGAVDELERFAHVLARVPEEMRPALSALAPPRLVVGRHEIHCSVNIATRHEVSFELLVKPISLGFSALHGRSEGQRMSLYIELAPAPLSLPDTNTESR